MERASSRSTEVAGSMEKTMVSIFLCCPVGAN
jgi:hypothetical protein